MALQEILYVTVSFFLFLHIPAFVLYNKYRIRKMLYYLGLCRGRELTEKDYVDLLDEYTSFLGYTSFSPNRKYYPALYTNLAFAAFAQQSKLIMRYLAVAVGGGFLTLLILSALFPE